MGKKILLADDSITIQKVVELTFSDGDFDVVSVSNGEQALRKAREFKPDIALLDVIMPEKNGYEVCQILKQDTELRHIPILLLTGTFESFDRARADEVGADGYLTKPFESQMLISKVEELLATAPRQIPASAHGGPMQVVTSGTILNVEEAGPEAPAPVPPPEAPEPFPEAREAAPTPRPEPPEAAAGPPLPPELEPSWGEGESAEDTGAERASDAPSFGSEPFAPFEPAPPPTGADVPAPEFPPASEPPPEPSSAAAAEDVMMVDEGPPPPSPEGGDVGEPVAAAGPHLAAAAPGELQSESKDAYEQTFEMPGEPETIALAGKRPAEELGPGTLYSGPAPPATPTPASGGSLTPAQVDEIARRVVERLSDQVIREVAWEVIPDLAEILIRKRISELERDGEGRG